jgi:hypothetical protein
VRMPRTHPHILRYTFITTMLDASVSLRDVQIAARHADPKTTMRSERAAKPLPTPQLHPRRLHGLRNVTASGQDPTGHAELSGHCCIKPFQSINAASFPPTRSDRRSGRPSSGLPAHQ